jgi:hypothetical protein
LAADQAAEHPSVCTPFLSIRAGTDWSIASFTRTSLHENMGSAVRQWPWICCLACSFRLFEAQRSEDEMKHVAANLHMPNAENRERQRILERSMVVLLRIGGK